MSKYKVGEWVLAQVSGNYIKEAQEDGKTTREIPVQIVGVEGGKNGRYVVSLDHDLTEIEFGLPDDYDGTSKYSGIKLKLPAEKVWFTYGKYLRRKKRCLTCLGGGMNVFQVGDWVLADLHKNGSIVYEKCNESGRTGEKVPVRVVGIGKLGADTIYVVSLDHLPEIASCSPNRKGNGSFPHYCNTDIEIACQRVWFTCGKYLSKKERCFTCLGGLG